MNEANREELSSRNPPTVPNSPLPYALVRVESTPLARLPMLLPNTL